MGRLLAFFGAFGLVLVGFGVQPVYAQGAFRPSNPAYSPWLHLYDRSAGPLGGYLSDARPKMDLLQSLNQQRSAIDRQGAEIQLLGQAAARGQGDAIAPTGVSSTFMNYSHYFPNRAHAAAPRRAAAPSAAARAMPTGVR